jgi:Zn-dependent peptidase ImmA (M78 family)
VDLSRGSLLSAVDLEKVWRVSVQSLLIRADHLGLISSASKKIRLWRELPARGWRRRKAAALTGIPLLDHVIVAARTSHSIISDTSF